MQQAGWRLRMKCLEAGLKMSLLQVVFQHAHSNSKRACGPQHKPPLTLLRMLLCWSFSPIPHGLPAMHSCVCWDNRNRQQPGLCGKAAADRAAVL